MKTEAEVRVMQPQARVLLEPPEAEGGKNRFSPRADTLVLGFWLPEL